MDKKKRSFLLTMLIVYVFFLFLGVHFYRGFMEAKANSDLPNLINFVEADLSNNPMIIQNKDDLKVIVFITFGFTIFVLLKLTEREKKYRPGTEHGSARWGTKKEMKKIRDKDKYKNIILSNDVFLSLNTRKTRKNLNVCILGGTGAGKTRFYVKPNLLLANTSYILTDPKGDLFRETGRFFSENGYEIKVINTKNMKESMKYNLFRYIRSDEDVLKMVDTLIKNTNKGKSGGDPFWEKAETTLLLALFFYLYYEAPKEEQNLPMVMEMIDYAEVKEEDEEFESDLDTLFKELEEENPHHIAVRQYNSYKVGAGKTLKSILISVKTRLAFLTIPTVAELLSEDEMELDLIGDRKTILYVIIPDTDTTYNFLIAMLYTQLFDVLINRADNVHHGQLPFHVRGIFDEFANIGQIPEFEKILATIRSRGISANIILQSIAQIKAMYKESWETIIDCCDSTVFLGGQKTAEYISKKLGRETIDYRTINKTTGKNGSSSINNSILGKELMTTDDVETMPDEDSIVFIRGMRPFKTKKYKIEKDKKYKKLGSDGDNPNNFYYKDLVAYLEKKEKANKEDLSLENINFSYENINNLMIEIDE
ncbi:VirD4-like conjugal transfer protein, CD1115 family (plasmid) [Clostridium perfringens]|uniref:VirD4-like conjugal transfer protein, CD1115 family n=2 Tax=Clostridium perfringens TaxID=1502 RepID=UPI0024BCC420|nr:type IV secretory system conjugative DNA transfer family protein [Clostridium perfringens]